jgi:nucleoside-diphosphate-sugar epimerase
VNIGSGMEITIKELVTVLTGLIGFKGRIRWDTTKPNGQPRRSLDVSRARDSFGFSAQTDFMTGLRHTVEWWETVGVQTPELTELKTGAR